MSGELTKPVDSSSPTVSTSITVPPSIVPTSHGVDSWSSVSIFIAGLFAVMGGGTAIFGFVKGILDFLDRSKTRDQQKLKPVLERLDNLENGTRNFRSVDQLDKDNQRIEEMVKHLKGNMQQQMDYLEQRVRNVEGNYNDLNLKYTKLEGKVDNCLEQNQRIVKSVDRLEEKIDQHFKDMTELLLNNNPQHTV